MALARFKSHPRKMSRRSMLQVIALAFLAIGVYGVYGNGVDEKLRKLEKRRFEEAMRASAEMGYSVRGFYHVSTWRKHFRDVIMDQLYLMAGKRSIFGDGHGGHLNKNAPAESNRGFTSGQQWASLLDAVDALELNVAGSLEDDVQEIKKLVLTHMSGAFSDAQLLKIQFSFNQTITRGTFRKLTPEQKQKVMDGVKGRLSEGESSTLHRMWNYCRRETDAGRKSVVFYIHSKGACCYPAAERDGGSRRGPDDVGNAVSSWRNVMNTFTLEFPSICLRAILGGYTTCGYGSQGGASARAHFSGNFFWADCGHIAALPRIITFFDAWKAEFFVGRTSKLPQNRLHIMHRCAYESHHCDLKNHYAEVCKRSSYYKRIESLINSSSAMPALNSRLSDPWYRSTSDASHKIINLRKGYNSPEILKRTGYYASRGAPRLTDECRPLFANGTGKYQDQAFYYQADYFEES